MGPADPLGPQQTILQPSFHMHASVGEIGLLLSSLQRIRRGTCRHSFFWTIEYSCQECWTLTGTSSSFGVLGVQGAVVGQTVDSPESDKG